MAYFQEFAFWLGMVPTEGDGHSYSGGVTLHHPTLGRFLTLQLQARVIYSFVYMETYPEMTSGKIDATLLKHPFVPCCFGVDSSILPRKAFPRTPLAFPHLAVTRFKLELRTSISSNPHAFLSFAFTLPSSDS